jgi:hypothetical protein
MPKRKNKPKRSLENVHEEYDENGRWKQERNRVKGALRQSFRMSPQMWETLQRAKHELPPALKKDGTPGKRPQVRYKCAICGNMFMQKYIQVDHLIPVVPLHKVEADMTYDEMADRIFCDKDNLQVVCSTPLKKNNGEPSCHKIKSDEENFIRRELVEKLKEEKNIDIEDEIELLKVKYQAYIDEKEIKRIEKEKRKAEREAKRKAKEDEKRQRNSRKSKKA